MPKTPRIVFVDDDDRARKKPKYSGPYGSVPRLNQLTLSDLEAMNAEPSLFSRALDYVGLGSTTANSRTSSSSSMDVDGGYTAHTMRRLNENFGKDWAGRTVRPPQEMTIALNYRNQSITSMAMIVGAIGTAKDATENPPKAVGPENYFLNYKLFYCNSLFKQDPAAAAVEPFPALTQYVGLWSRALVTRVRYIVTFMALTGNTAPITGFIAFIPMIVRNNDTIINPLTTPVAPDTTVTFAPKTWSQWDNVVHSDANCSWATSTTIGLPTASPGHVTIENDMYLPNQAGNVSAYLSSVQQTPTVGTGARDFSTPLASPMTVHPNTVLCAEIGIMSWDFPVGLTKASVAQSVSMSISAILEVKLYRSGLMT